MKCVCVCLYLSLLLGYGLLMKVCVGVKFSVIDVHQLTNENVRYVGACARVTVLCCFASCHEWASMLKAISRVGTTNYNKLVGISYACVPDNRVYGWGGTSLGSENCSGHGQVVLEIARGTLGACVSVCVSWLLRWCCSLPCHLRVLFLSSFSLLLLCCWFHRGRIVVHGQANHTVAHTLRRSLPPAPNACPFLALSALPPPTPFRCFFATSRTWSRESFNWPRRRATTLT